jgi:hypothetical protein
MKVEGSGGLWRVKIHFPFGLFLPKLYPSIPSIPSTLSTKRRIIYNNNRIRCLRCF